jgi:hypothetical protein
MTLEQLIESAEQDLKANRAYGGSEFQQFGLYIVPVEQRTRAMKSHYRMTYYLNRKRVTKDAFLEEWGNVLAQA